MHSPARQHFIRKSAAAANQAEADAAIRPDATQYELHLAQLAEHRRSLKGIHSIERKIEFKRQALPEYSAYVEGVLQGDRGAQDDVITTVMVWRIDAGDIDGAIQIATYVLRHNIALPDQYQRDAACVIAEETAEHALLELAHDGGADAVVIHDQLVEVARLVDGHDMPDEVTAKLYKAIGYAARGFAPKAARDALDRALQLNPKCGVKKDIERLDRAIKNAKPGDPG